MGSPQSQAAAACILGRAVVDSYYTAYTIASSVVNHAPGSRETRRFTLVAGDTHTPMDFILAGRDHSAAAGVLMSEERLGSWRGEEMGWRAMKLAMRAGLALSILIAVPTSVFSQTNTKTLVIAVPAIPETLDPIFTGSQMSRYMRDTSLRCSSHVRRAPRTRAGTRLLTLPRGRYAICARALPWLPMARSGS